MLSIIMAFEIMFLIGRVLFGLFHINSGLGHLLQFRGTKEYAKAKKVPLPELSVFLTAGLLLLGGASIVLGFYPQIGASLLVIFYIPVTLMMHQFWAVPKEQKMAEIINFTKNIALLGAALVLFSLPLPWAYSL